MSNKNSKQLLLRIPAACALALVAAACAQLPETAPTALTTTETRGGSEIPQAPVPEPPAESPVAPAQSEPVAAPAQPEPPPPPADVWQRIRSGYRLTPGNGRLVRDWEQWYSTRPDYVGRMVERARRYLYHVVEEVERRRMPTEIALLPMIESAFNPQAYSRAHAAGMWQFIPSTGKNYGLRQNFWYDGRRDIIAATSAALDYLENLYAMFGNWEHALAAYNWGEGAVARAIARNQARGLPTDYESLAMPNETRNYVPKLMAVRNIVADPAYFGLQLAVVPNEPYFATITTSRHIDVTLAAQLAEITIEEFRFLNPAHNKPVIKADGSETIVLPRHKIETFRANLEAHDKPLVSWRTYTLKRNDSPEKIAAKHGITLAELKEANGITGRKRFTPGQTLLVPHRGSAEPHLPDLPAPKVALPRYRGKAKCYQTIGGVKKQVPCAAPAKKTTTTTAREPAKPVNVTLSSSR